MAGVGRSWLAWPPRLERLCCPDPHARDHTFDGFSNELSLKVAVDFTDNISANVIGLGLGMLFRFWSYRTFVFRHPEWREEGWPEDEAMRYAEGDEEPLATRQR